MGEVEISRTSSRARLNRLVSPSTRASSSMRAPGLKYCNCCYTQTIPPAYIRLIDSPCSSNRNSSSLRILTRHSCIVLVPRKNMARCVRDSRWHSRIGSVQRLMAIVVAAAMPSFGFFRVALCLRSSQCPPRRLTSGTDFLVIVGPSTECDPEAVHVRVFAIWLPGFRAV